MFFFFFFWILTFVSFLISVKVKGYSPLSLHFYRVQKCKSYHSQDSILQNKWALRKIKLQQNMGYDLRGQISHFSYKSEQQLYIAVIIVLGHLRILFFHSTLLKAMLFVLVLDFLSLFLSSFNMLYFSIWFTVRIQFFFFFSLSCACSNFDFFYFFGKNFNKPPTYEIKLNIDFECFEFQLQTH